MWQIYSLVIKSALCKFWHRVPPPLLWPKTFTLIAQIIFSCGSLSLVGNVMCSGSNNQIRSQNNSTFAKAASSKCFRAVRQMVCSWTQPSLSSPRIFSRLTVRSIILYNTGGGRAWMCFSSLNDFWFLFTDNVFSIKSWTKKKFAFDDSRINKAFGIPEDFDYMDWSPAFLPEVTVTIREE